MDVPEGNVISDGDSHPKDHGAFGLPLAAIICIAIVIYGLFVLICIFARQVILNRRPLGALESLHCCECLLLIPKPAVQFCDLPCGRSGKPEVPTCKLNFDWLWAALPAVRCRLPDSPPGPGCWPPVLPAAQCPSSVRCCGLEIRRDTRPGMVDASVPAAEVLGSPAAAGRPSWRGTALETAECRQYGRTRADSGPYSTRSAALDTPLTGDYIRHTAASGDYNCRTTVSGEDDRQTSQFSDYSHHTSQSGDYNRHAAQTSDSSERTADSSKYSQHRAVLDPTALL